MQRVEVGGYNGLLQGPRREPWEFLEATGARRGQPEYDVRDGIKIPVLGLFRTMAVPALVG